MRKCLPQPKNPTIRNPDGEQLITATILLIVGMLGLTAMVPLVVRLIEAVTPLVLVVGTLAVVWQ